MNKILNLIVLIISINIFAQRKEYADIFSKKDKDSVLYYYINKQEKSLQNFFLKNDSMRISFKNLLICRCINDLYEYQYNEISKLNKGKNKNKTDYLLNIYNSHLIPSSKFWLYTIYKQNKYSIFNLIDEYSKNIIIKNLEEFKKQHYKDKGYSYVGIQFMSPYSFCQKQAESNYNEYFEKLINTVEINFE